MLQTIRDNVQGWAAKIIIAIIIVPFALFGIDSLFGANPNPPVAEINGEEISEMELQRAMALQKRRLLNIMGQNIDPSILEDSVLRQPSLNALIEQKLLLQSAGERGLAISDTQLNQAIVQMPQFQVDGQFSNERYQQMLRVQGYTSSFFKELLASELLLNQLQSGVAGSAFVTPKELAQAARLLEEKRSFNYLEVPLSRFEASVDVSEAELQAYYDENKSQYVTQEKVKLNYIDLHLEDFFQPVDEQTIRAEYEREIAAIERETSRRAAHILLETNADRNLEQARSEAKALVQQLEQGADFAELARSQSDDIGSAEAGGDLGYTAGDAFPEAFEDALASLEEGEVSEPVVTDAGVHVIKLLEVSRTEVPEFEQRREDIARRLQEQNAQPLLLKKAEALRDLVFNAEDLEGPAEELSLSLSQTDWLSRDSEWLSTAPMRDAAFSDELTEQGLNSEVFELSNQHYRVVRVDQYQSPQQQPLAEVADSIEAVLKQSKAAKQAREFALQLQAELNDGAQVDALAEQHDLDWQAIVRETRQQARTEEAIRQAAFALPKAGSTAHVDLQERHIVLLLKGVEAGDLELLSEERRAAVLQSQQRRQASLSFGGWFQSVLDDADVEIR